MQKRASSRPNAGVASPQRRHWPKSHAAPSCGWRPRAWASWGAAWRMRWSVIALCTSAPITAHTLRVSCIHRWTAHRTRRLALTRAPPPLSLRAQRVAPHGPVEHHALRHSIEKQSSRGRRAQQHEQQLQQQPFRSWWSMVAAAGGATSPRTTRTLAPPSPSQTWTTGRTLTRRRVRACAAGHSST